LKPLLQLIGLFVVSLPLLVFLLSFFNEDRPTIGLLGVIRGDVVVLIIKTWVNGQVAADNATQPAQLAARAAN
jgi:hypothetical protein